MILHKDEIAVPAELPATRAPKLPARDYILIPLTSLLTIACMVVIAEMSSRAIWPEQTLNTCVEKDQFGILHAKPNCTSETKTAESPWVSYHFNACGYRTDAACGPKPAGAIRIVMLGSSISEGLHVVYDQTFAERTAKALEKATGRQVQIENLALATMSPLHVYRRLDEALALHPDLVVYAVAPLDLEHTIDPVELANRNNPLVTLSSPPTLAKNTPIKKLQNLLNDSRAFQIAQHFLFSNTETFLRLYMAYGDKADYLRHPLSAHWKGYFADFDLILADMGSRLNKAGIPFFVMAVPSRQAGALMSVAQRPPHSDAFLFGQEIQDMAARDDFEYVDAIREFSKTPDCDRFFYPVDLHITGEGHALLANVLLRKLYASGIPALKLNDNKPQAN